MTIEARKDGQYWKYKFQYCNINVSRYFDYFGEYKDNEIITTTSPEVLMAWLKLPNILNKLSITKEVTKARKYNLLNLEIYESIVTDFVEHGEVIVVWKSVLQFTRKNVV